MRKKQRVMKALRFTIGMFETHDCITVSCNDDFTTMLKEALEVLEDQKPVKAEIEGSGHNWWNVCGECHGNIGSMDKYCRHCGREISWV